MKDWRLFQNLGQISIPWKRIYLAKYIKVYSVIKDKTFIYWEGRSDCSLKIMLFSVFLYLNLQFSLINPTLIPLCLHEIYFLKFNLRNFLGK